MEFLIYLLLIVITTMFFIPVLLVAWLWFFHDRRIKRLRKELFNIPTQIQEGFRGRGVTSGGIEPHIKAAQRPIEVELKKREFARRLFLDRAHFISLFKFK